MKLAAYYSISCRLKYKGGVVAEVAFSDNFHVITTVNLFKSSQEIEQLTRMFITENEVFGYLACLQLADFFDKEKLENAKQFVHNSDEIILIVSLVFVGFQNCAMLTASLFSESIQIGAILICQNYMKLILASRLIHLICGRNLFLIL